MLIYRVFEDWGISENFAGAMNAAKNPEVVAANNVSGERQGMIALRSFVSTTIQPELARLLSGCANHSLVEGIAHAS